MPTSKVIRPAVFDETGEHVIPADADLNLDPVSSDPDNYIVRGSDGGAFLNGDGVLSNDGENLLKITPNDGKVTYPRSKAVDLIRDTMQAALDVADERINNAQDAADKAQATADQAKEDAAAAQCTATQALDKAKETDLTGYTHTGNTVSITGYVSGSGSFDRNGNVTVDVVADIRDTPYTYYVGKTNARDYWGKDENGNQWGSTKDHPFASLTYAINQSNSHVFPGNTINIYVNDSGEYVEEGRGEIFVTSHTIIRGTTSEHPVFRCWWDMYLSAQIELSAVDFAISKAPTADSAPDGVRFFRVSGLGELHIENGCHMVIDSDNFGKNTWAFIEMGWHGGSSLLSLTCNNGPALYLELRGNGVTHKAPYIKFLSNSAFGVPLATGPMAAIKLVSPSGTKHTGSVLGLDRFISTHLLATPYPGYKLYFDWDIADDSGTSQVDLGKFAALALYKNPGKGQALPGSSIGNVPDLADYAQREYA